MSTVLSNGHNFKTSFTYYIWFMLEQTSTCCEHFFSSTIIHKAWILFIGIFQGLPMLRITPPQTDIINKLTAWKITPDEIPTKYYNRNAKILNTLFHDQMENNIIYIISFIQYYLSHNVLYVDFLRMFLRKLIISFLLKMSVAFLFNSHRVIWYAVKISNISIKSIFLSVNFCFSKNGYYCMGGARISRSKWRNWWIYWNWCIRKFYFVNLKWLHDIHTAYFLV